MLQTRKILSSPQKFDWRMEKDDSWMEKDDSWMEKDDSWMELGEDKNASDDFQKYGSCVTHVVRTGISMFFSSWQVWVL